MRELEATNERVRRHRLLRGAQRRQTPANWADIFQLPIHLQFRRKTSRWNPTADAKFLRNALGARFILHENVPLGGSPCMLNGKPTFTSGERDSGEARSFRSNLGPWTRESIAIFVASIYGVSPDSSSTSSTRLGFQRVLFVEAFSVLEVIENLSIILEFG